MKSAAMVLVPMMLFSAMAIGLAAYTTDSLSGLPLPPDSMKFADPVQSYKYCGKSAQLHAYMYSGLGNDDEDLVATAKAWYMKAMPHANVFSAPSGQVTFVTADGTAAVILSGSIIGFVRFSPGLSAAEMKGFGDAPTSKQCPSGA